MTSRTRHPKTAAALAAGILVAGFAIATHGAKARGWAAGHAAHGVDALGQVEPADRATVLSRAPAFTWPAVSGAKQYTIALTFPDGHTEARSTHGNWFAWDRPVPSGRYRWQVRVAGRARVSGDTHWFVVDQAARG